MIAVDGTPNGELRSSTGSVGDDGLSAHLVVGDDVVACDGRVGHVTRLLRTERAVPRYMIVATGRVWRRYPVIECGLITEIDDHVVRVRGSKRILSRLPEALPLVV